MVAENPQKRNRGQHPFLEELPNLHAEVDGLQQWICRAAEDGSAAHEVERNLFDKLLALGKTLFQAFLTLVGPGDFGESVTLDDGRLVHRSKEEHVRRLLTVFGEFRVSRWVYARRDKTKIEFAPTDQRLQLPASEVSYLLQEWDQLLGVEHAFGKVREVIQTILRLTQSVDTLEHTNQQMAAAAPVFRDEQGPALIAAKARKRTRSRWPASAASTRWIGTHARRRNWWQRCFAIRIGPRCNRPKLRTNVTGRNSVANSTARKFAAKIWCFNDWRRRSKRVAGLGNG
jgi:hypothetical protein